MVLMSKTGSGGGVTSAAASCMENDILDGLEARPRPANECALDGRPERLNGTEEWVIDTEECWTINIKSPASLNIDTGSPDQDGFAVDTYTTIHSNNREYF